MSPRTPVTRLHRSIAPAFLALGTTALVATAAPTVRIPPRPATFVADGANILTTATREQLERTLAVFQQRTGNTLLVVTVTSQGGATIEEYGNALIHEWGIGNATKDNGVLLILAPDTRKVRIEVGYGLEETLTDATASRILRERVTPRLRAGDPAGGLVAGVEAIVSLLGHALHTPQPALESSRTPERGIAEAHSSIDRPPEPRYSLARAAVAILLAIVICAVIVWHASNLGTAHRRMERLRAALRRRIDEWRSQVLGAARDLESQVSRAQAFLLLPADAHFLTGVRRRADLLLREELADLDRLTALTSEVEDPAAAWAHLNQFAGLASFARIGGHLTTYVERRERAALMAPDAVQALHRAIEAAQASFDQGRTDGYRLDAVAQQILAAEQRYTDAAFSLAAIPPDPERALTLVAEGDTLATRVLEKIAATRNLRQTLPNIVAALRAKRTALDTVEHPAARLQLAELQRTTPEAVWSPIAALLAALPSRFDAIDRALREAERLLAMDVQQFDDAAQELQSLETVLASIQETLALPGITRAQLSEAEAAVPALRADIAEARTYVDVILSDDLVSAAVRERFTEVLRELSSADAAWSAPPPKNPVQLAATFATILEALRDLRVRAERDIRDAEAVREGLGRATREESAARGLGRGGDVARWSAPSRPNPARPGHAGAGAPPRSSDPIETPAAGVFPSEERQTWSEGGGSDVHSQHHDVPSPNFGGGDGGGGGSTESY